MLAHRLSLIPINFKPNEINNWNVEDFTFVINETNMTQDNMDITTEHIQIFDKNQQKLSREVSASIFPANNVSKDHILITKLKPNGKSNEFNKIHVELKATKGTPKKCICYTTVSQATYFNKIDEQIASEKLSLLLKNVDQTKHKQITAHFNTLEIQKCFSKNKYGEPNHFQFLLESECQLPPHYIYFQAINILVNQLENIEKEIIKHNDSDVFSIENNSDIPDFYVINIKQQSHTIGNLLQSLIFNKFIREKHVSTNFNNNTDTDYHLDYIGYTVPHPLEELLVLKLKFKQKTPQSKLIEFLLKAVNLIKTDLVQINKNWILVSALLKTEIKDVIDFENKYKNV